MNILLKTLTAGINARIEQIQSQVGMLSLCNSDPLSEAERLRAEWSVLMEAMRADMSTLKSPEEKLNTLLRILSGESL
jgi:hypothetical protein